jgi:hypothetical protein
MDPATLAAAAVAFVTPYLIDFAKNLGSDVASEGSKSVWGWIKGKLTSAAGAEAVGKIESVPTDSHNVEVLQNQLIMALKADPDAAKAFADLLKTSGASLPSHSVNITGSNNKVGQANGGSSVTIG